MPWFHEAVLTAGEETTGLGCTSRACDGCCTPNVRVQSEASKAVFVRRSLVATSPSYSDYTYEHASIRPRRLADLRGRIKQPPAAVQGSATGQSKKVHYSRPRPRTHKACWSHSLVAPHQGRKCAAPRPAARGKQGTSDRLAALTTGRLHPDPTARCQCNSAGRWLSGQPPRRSRVVFTVSEQQARVRELMQQTRFSSCATRLHALLKVETHKVPRPSAASFPEGLGS